MLKELELVGVGPSARLGPIKFSERLNLITGDNGLGKSFVLDVAWWALTGTWPDRQPWPREECTRDTPPTMNAVVVGKAGADSTVESQFNFDTQEWDLKGGGRPAMPGLVLYFRVDGRFSVWDPAQHYWRRNKAKGVDDPNRPEALHLGPDEIWNSLPSSDGKTICRGLIEDWVTWQQTASPEFTLLERVLQTLSPSTAEPLRPGRPLDPLALALDDRRAHPTLDLPYGRTPVVLASAGMKRVLALSYLLVWAWQGHKLAAQSLKQPAENRVVILFDEPETHLHPQWQRRVVPSLLKAVEELGALAQVQILVSTHSPLVLASVEPTFEPSRDTLLHFSLESSGPTIRDEGFAKWGDVDGWLESEVFGLEHARSIESERAIEAAEALLREDRAALAAPLDSRESIHEVLVRLLPGDDPFWARWIMRKP